MIVSGSLQAPLHSEMNSNGTEPYSAVEAALSLRRFFPPPACGSLVLTRARGSRAGLASNRNVSLIVELVVGDIVVSNESPNFLLAPSRNRIELRHTLRLVSGVPDECRDINTRGTLVTALTRDPRIKI